MANRLQKLIYFLSAESPVLFIFSIVWWHENQTLKVPLILSAFAMVFIVVFAISFHYGRRHLPPINVKVTDTPSADGQLVAFVITYLIPLGSLAIKDYYFPVALVGIILLQIVLIFTDYVTPHPLLFLVGYHFYSISVEGASSGYILASRKKIRSGRGINTVQRVFEFLLVREK